MTQATNNDTVIESRLLAEQTVRPISACVPLILWTVALFVITSTITSFFEPLPEFVPGWLRVFNGVVDTFFVVIFAPLVTLILATVFTVIFFMFPGVRYRIFTDRIEYQRGKHLCLYPLQKITFGEWQTLDYSELDSIYWTVEGIGDESPPDTTFIEFHFASRKFQLHVCLELSGQVAEACRMIERDTIVPKILRALEDGKTVPFLRPDKFPSYEIEIDDKMIRDWDQHRFSWNEIGEISFSKGKVSRYGDYLAQCRIRIKNTSGESMEFDMPMHNPHAFWAVIKSRCSLPSLQVLNFPKKENDV
jgi:hypothetical protein